MEQGTSYGQQLCRRYIELYTEAKFIENFRPEWLFGMELDFFFPDHNAAIEFNGDQHYHATSLASSPMAQIIRDKRKREICKQRGITLVSIKAIDLIQHRMRRRISQATIPMVKLRRNNALRDDSIRYRKILKEKYSSPTACMSNKKPYKKALKNLKAKYSHHKPNPPMNLLNKINLTHE